MKNLDGMLELVLHSLVSFIADSQLLGDFFIISGQSGQFLLDFSPWWSDIYVDGGQFVDAADWFFILLLNGPFRT